LPTSARTRVRLLARGAALTAIAIAAVPAFTSAIGQERPESILPPGFGEPASQPAARPTPARTGASAAPAPAASGTPASGQAAGTGMVQP
jgi:hypothetical protein